jgi:hypothetical protein
VKIFGKNGQTVINGKRYTGNNISIIDGQVIVDGVVQGEVGERKIEIQVLCNVDQIFSEESITINGNVTGDIEAKMSVNCDNVTGNVSAGMSVNCDDVGGNVSAGMTVNCDDIRGNATANKINR